MHKANVNRPLGNPRRARRAGGLGFTGALAALSAILVTATAQLSIADVAGDAKAAPPASSAAPPASSAAPPAQPAAPPASSAAPPAQPAAYAPPEDTVFQRVE